MVVFRLVRSTNEEANLANQRLHDVLAARHDVFLTQTMLHSRGKNVFCIRMALGGQFTTMDDVNAVWEVVVEAARGIAQ